MTGLLQANLQYLQQAADLVDFLEDGSYVREEPMFYNSTVGGHLRHCLEHYEAFTSGLGEGKIDYDARCRDELVENKTCAARERIQSITNQLEQLKGRGLDQRISVKMDCDGAADGGGDESDSTSNLSIASTDCDPWQASTVGRELQFLISHTVHHFAMIRGICQRANIELEQSFGMAPSTLRHRANMTVDRPVAPA